MGRLFLDPFTLFVPEIIFYPALGPWKTYTATVRFAVQLSDLRSDLEVAEEQVLFDGDSNRRWGGKWHAMVSSSSEHFAKFHQISNGWEIVESH